MIFFLGAHHPDWLARAGVPLFVSRRSFGKSLPRAIAPWALDSGGFTELSLHGRWTTSAAEYVADVRRIASGVGLLEFAAPQDWMCEPGMLAKTGFTVEEHQRRTVENFIELRSLAPELPFIPVLQGWTMGDYWRHVEAYEAAGVRLSDQRLVGIGSVCRRQNTASAGALIATLAAEGIRLHGFGFKAGGLKSTAGKHLSSADSMAWSLNARKSPPLQGHPHKSCSNCLEYALGWRDELHAGIGRAA